MHKKKETSKEKSKVKRVMEEFKHGELHSGNKNGPKVSSSRQARAIAMSESGLSKKIHKKK